MGDENGERRYDDLDLESDLDDPLEELVSRVEAGEAQVYIDDMPWGNQARIDFEGDFSVSAEEHDAKGVVLEYNEEIIEMVESENEEWGEILDSGGITDDRVREMLITIVRDARDDRE